MRYKTCMLVVGMAALVLTNFVFLMYLQKRLRPEEPSPIQFLNANGKTYSQADNTSPIELVIGIVSVARRNHEDYLLQTLKSIKREADAYSHSRTESILKSVIVLHPRTEDTPHQVFTQAKSELVDDSRFTFYSRDAKDDTLTEKVGLTRNMTARDQQQLLDAKMLYSTVHTEFCKSRPNAYMLLMEDDFDLCPHAFMHYHRIIHAAENIYFPKFSAIRTAVGFSGILIHCYDVDAHRELFEIFHYGLPADTLLSWHYESSFEFSKAMYENVSPKRKYAVYRHNLMEHIGHTTSIKNIRNDRVFPGCYDTLHFRSLLADCPGCYEEHDACQLKEFSPCDHPQMGDSMLTALRGNSLYDTRFMMTDETSTKITLVKGQANLDCNQVCGSKKLNCAAYMLPIINKCNVLHEHFKCHLCQDHPFGYPTPTRNPGYENTTEQCFVSTVLGALSCEGNVENFERLCPCANRRKKKQFKLSPKLLRVAMPKTVDFEENSLKMGELLDLAKANTCHRAAALLAQVSYETEDLRYKFQLGNFDPLENRKDLENTETGDGERYKGRGYLQIAGKKNYREASKALGVDFVANPDLVASNAHGPKVAAWYWRKIGANKLADTTFKGSFREITNRLTGYKNTDPNHRDRRKIWINVQRALGCMVYGSNFM